MFAFALHERDSGRAGLGARPLRHQAALPGRDGGHAALCLDAAGAGPGERRRHLDRPGGAAPLHELARRRAGAAHDPQRRAQAAGGDDPHLPAGRHLSRHDLLGAELRAQPGGRVAAAWTNGPRWCWTACARPCAGAWWPTCRSACCSPGGVDSSLIVGLLAEERPVRPRHLLDRLRGGAWRERRRVPVFRPDRRALRHRPPQDLHPLGGDAREPAGGDRGDVRADGQLRQHRLLPAQPRGGEDDQGGAVRTGRRRGLRRLSLVPAARGVERCGRRLCRRVLRPDARAAGRAPEPRAHGRPRREPGVRARPFRPSRRRRRRRQGAAARHQRHAGRRPGQAGRQHDHGLGARGAGALPRPRAGRARGPRAGRAQARRRRQGRAEGRRAPGDPERGHRPARRATSRCRR